MLHLQSAGFERSGHAYGRPVVFEMWAMPTEDEAMTLFKSLRAQLDTPTPSAPSWRSFLKSRAPTQQSLFPGDGGRAGHWDRHVDPALGPPPGSAHHQHLSWPGRSAGDHSQRRGLPRRLPHGSLPDSVDEKTPLIGYLPGKMP